MGSSMVGEDRLKVLDSDLPILYQLNCAIDLFLVRFNEYA